MSDCLFCKIIAGDIPSKKVYEDDLCYAFYDIAPMAKLHFLVIPKLHLASAAEINDDNAAVIGHIYAVIAKLAKEMGFAEAGKKLLRNRTRNITVIAAGVLLVLAVIVTLSLTTNLFPIRQTTSINPMEYIAQIGLPWDAAMENLGLNSQQLEEVSIGLFKTPRKASFYSYDFDVYLILGKWGNYVKAFEYYLEDVDPKDFTKLNDAMIALYGDQHPGKINQKTVDTFLTGVEARSIESSWIIRSYEPGELEEYRPAVNKDHYWPNNPDYDDYILCTLMLIRDETGSYRISLSYSLNVR